MLALSAVNLVWWIVGGTCVVIGVAQIASALGGPAERRPTAFIGVLLLLLGALAALMPAFGTGAAPPGPRPLERPAPDRTISAWSEASVTSLLRALPDESSKLDALQSEIIARLDAGEIPADRVGELLDLCLAGRGSERPPAAAWEARYGRILATIRMLVSERRVTLDDEQRARWLDLPADYEVRARPRWPEGVDPVVHVRLRHFWPEAHLRLRLVPRLEGVAPLLVARDGPWPLAGANLLPGRHEIRIDVEVQRLSGNLDAAGATPEIVGRDVVTLPIEVGGTAADVLPPVSMTSMDAILREGLKVRLERGDGIDQVLIDPAATAVPVFDGVALGVRLEVVAGDSILARATASWRGGTDGDREAIRVRLTPRDGASLDDAPTPLTVRLRGDAATALPVIDATRHWRGAVEIPLVEISR